MTAVVSLAGARRAEFSSWPVPSCCHCEPPSVERKASAIIPVGHIAHSTSADEAWMLPPSPEKHGLWYVVNRAPEPVPATSSWLAWLADGGDRDPQLAAVHRHRHQLVRTARVPGR